MLGLNGEGVASRDLTQVNESLQRAYQPRPYGGHVTLFRPKDRFARYDDPQFGWSELIPNLQVREVPVYPRGMLVEPFVRTLTDRLRDCLRPPA